MNFWLSVCLVVHLWLEQVLTKEIKMCINYSAHFIHSNFSLALVIMLLASAQLNTQSDFHTFVQLLMHANDLCTTFWMAELKKKCYFTLIKTDLHQHYHEQGNWSRIWMRMEISLTTDWKVFAENQLIRVKLIVNFITSEAFEGASIRTEVE